MRSVRERQTCMDWHIEPWTSEHDRSTFSCGKESLDEFLRLRVSQFEKRNLGKTFVAVPSDSTPGTGKVIGYYTLAAGAVSFEHLPSNMARKLPKPPVPVVLLARLAVDQSWQGIGLGESLLLDALSRSVSLSSELGIYAVKVDAIDQAATKFYAKYGFIALPDSQLGMFLPIATVKKVLG